MTAFCAEHGLSRKTFYAILARARDEGPAAVLEPRSRRPKTSPTRIADEMKRQALDVRAALERSGLDHGPISVFDKMRKMGIEAPSVASLARIFRDKGVARAEPNKKPRAAYRRFVYPAPNACWQLDATEYVLTGGRRCVIFQLQDDHSRLAVASHVAEGETSQDALSVVRKGIAARGVPQRLLSDNGMALNPSRRGWEGQLVNYLTSLGVEAITGKPYKPTTQGKNERFHQTLFRWLDKQPLAATIAELQEQVDRFDVIYNTQRPHQALPGRITPQQAWDATEIAEPPRPKPAPPTPVVPEPATPGQPPAANVGPHQTGERHVKVHNNGVVHLHGIRFKITPRMAGQTIHAVWDTHTVTFADHNGEIITERPWPPPATTYVPQPTPTNTPSPMSRDINCHPSPDTEPSPIS